MHFSQLNVEMFLQIYEWVSRFSANNKSFEHAREVIPYRLLPVFQTFQIYCGSRKKYWKPQVFFFPFQNFFLIPNVNRCWLWMCVFLRFISHLMGLFVSDVDYVDDGRVCRGLKYDLGWFLKCRLNMIIMGQMRLLKMYFSLNVCFSLMTIMI